MLPMPRLPKTEKGNRIAFYGPMCSGKTYCADYLATNYEYTKVSFASPLKSIAYSYFGVLDKSGPSRKILQAIGQEFRKYDPDIWIKALLRTIEHEALPVVVDDLRYLNEAKALKRNGFVLVYVDCSPNTRFQRIRSLYPDTQEKELSHPSETEYLMIKPNYTVGGDGLNTILDLEQMYSDFKKDIIHV